MSLLTNASATAATAQVVTYTHDDGSISVNIPSDTASAGSGPIYFQISAPSGTQWVGFGQGSRMAGSNMFIVYAQDSTNVTLSPRLGTGHVMPQYNSDAQVTLMDGSGIQSDGTLVANVRCDNCNSWSGGSMDFTDSSSSWIYAARSGDALDTDDASARIQQHNTDTTFSLDLTYGTGGSSSNPFAPQSDDSSASASASASGASQTGSVSQTSEAAATATDGVSIPLASSEPGTVSSGNSGPSDGTETLLSAHGIIMSVLFLGLFPLAALTLYLPTTKKVRFIHAPLQVIGTILLIAGLVLGIVIGLRLDEIDGYHQVIGYIVVAMLVLFQPAMGLYQHLHYHKTGGRTIFGVMHRWLGRSMIVLGVINGGLGWQLTNSNGAYIPYAVIAAIVVLIYIFVVTFAWYTGRKPQDFEDEKARRPSPGYEMQQPKEAKHRRLSSDPPSLHQQDLTSNVKGRR